MAGHGQVHAHLANIQSRFPRAQNLARREATSYRASPTHLHCASTLSTLSSTGTSHMLAISRYIPIRSCNHYVRINLYLIWPAPRRSLAASRGARKCDVAARTRRLSCNSPASPVPARPDASGSRLSARNSLGPPRRGHFRRIGLVLAE